jgi:dTDP-4-dehydrorhamnose 3,5-epimerase
VRFIPTSLAGAYVIEVERRMDDRGFFARYWCRQEFEAAGLNAHLEQNSVSFNRKRGTLRGMHYQQAPHEEVKTVRCTQGRIWDVILDLRPDSATFRQWFAAELTAENLKMMYVPAGLAHGFQTLTDDAEVLYQISESYHAELARGVRWDDPAFQIKWPVQNPILSQRDREFSDFSVSCKDETCRPA